jgi:2,4-diketo-3-deoxy-L-fuconate hydrolase
MKLCRFDEGRIGVVREGRVFDVSACAQQLPVCGYPFPRHDLLIEALPSLRVELEREADKAPGIPLPEVRLFSPVANPGKIVAAPVNYQTHLDEARADSSINFGNQIQDIAAICGFLKATSALVGSSEGVAIRFPDQRNDHEIELVAVIGRTADRVSATAALDHVAGYCIGLDMTVRGTQDRSLRKSIDSYAVLGPWMVTSDEMGDISDLALELNVNGERRQYDRTSNLVISIADFIASVSRYFTLHPGDLIYSGTPMGVGPVKPGDLITASIDKIGTMEVAVRSA